MHINTQLSIKEGKRFAADERYMDKLEHQQKAAEPLIGKLCREGKEVCYINLLTKEGRYTGKTKEGSKAALFAYMVRNKYI